MGLSNIEAFMTDWMKSVQSLGRGIRNEELFVVAAGNNREKTIVMDMESDYNNWQHVMRPHYTELYTENGWEWFAYSRKPRLSVIYEAKKVIRKNVDGSLEYLKNRSGTGVGILNERETKEFLFTILSAKRI